MKKIFMSLAFVLVLPSVLHAANSEDVCDVAAQKEAQSFFDAYVAQTTEQLKTEAKEGDYEFSDDDVPGGLELSQSIDSVYSFSWGERQECACGVDVKTKKSKDGKSCKAQVDEKSQGCECG